MPGQWLIGVATSVALALGGWGLFTTATLQSRVAVTETKADYTNEAINRVEAKLDKLLEERRIAIPPEYRRPNDSRYSQAPSYRSPLPYPDLPVIPRRPQHWDGEGYQGH